MTEGDQRPYASQLELASRLSVLPFQRGDLRAHVKTEVTTSSKRRRERNYDRAFVTISIKSKTFVRLSVKVACEVSRQAYPAQTITISGLTIFPLVSRVNDSRKL